MIQTEMNIYSSVEVIDTSNVLNTLDNFMGAGKTQMEGCRKCKRDDDHPNLLLCEICNDEYHTYCLDPPLSSVPDHDFFCKKCAPSASFGNQDGLNALVAALAPTYTCRFGEIIWAAGGQGFGWWPACIYDPRLTVGGARKLAIKHLGKKHLVYFFACHDAPFTVLTESKITSWEDGLLEEYDLGKTARAVGRNKTILFEQALMAAIAENDKPVEYRLDWNHEDKPLVVGNGNGSGGYRNGAKRQQAVVVENQQNRDNSTINHNSTRKRPRRGHSTGANVDKPKTTAFVRRSSRGGKPLSNNSCSNQCEARIVENAIQLSRIEADERQRSENIRIMKLSTSSSTNSPMNRVYSEMEASTQLTCIGPEKKRILSIDEPKGESRAPKESLLLSSINNKKLINRHCEINASNEIEELENQQFFCKIFWKMSKTVVVKNSSLPSTIDDARVNLGFISLPCKKNSTFADLRKCMVRDLDVDCLPHDIKWKFYIPNLGPMSIHQEGIFGPLFTFLKKSTMNKQLGDGSSRNPLKIIIFESG